MLTIEADWSEAVQLVPDRTGKLIYDVPEIENIPEVSGVYIFARQYGQSVVPIYIGEAANLRKRLREHLKGSVQLMNALRRAPNGKRVFLCSKVQPKKKHDPYKARKILQDALIEHALSEGHQLVNKKGTKVPVHTISFTGNRLSEKLAPRRMYYRT